MRAKGLATAEAGSLRKQGRMALKEGRTVQRKRGRTVPKKRGRAVLKEQSKSRHRRHLRPECRCLLALDYNRKANALLQNRSGGQTRLRSVPHSKEEYANDLSVVIGRL